MKISEIFYSIQGEGTLVGVPSVFVRTSGCNLRCAWCDTPYTSWEPQGAERGVASIVDEVAGYGASHVVVTGGEPMIAPEIEELTEELARRLDGVNPGAFLAEVAAFNAAVEVTVPFDPTIKDGRMYGRGACDMKSGTIGALYALDAIKALNATR